MAKDIYIHFFLSVLQLHDGKIGLSLYFDQGKNRLRNRIETARAISAFALASTTNEPNEMRNTNEPNDVKLLQSYFS